MVNKPFIQAMIIVPSGCLNKKCKYEERVSDVLKSLDIRLSKPLYKVAKGGIKRGYLQSTAEAMFKNILHHQQRSVTIIDDVAMFKASLKPETLFDLFTSSKIIDLSHYVEEAARDAWEQELGEFIGRYHPQYYD